MGGAQKVFLTTLEGFLKENCEITAVVTHGPLVDHLSRYKNVELHVVDYGSLACLMDISRILKKRNYSVVNTYLTKCGLLFSIVNLFYRNPICCTLLNAAIHEKLNKAQRIVYPLFYFLLSKMCDGIIVNSGQNKKHLVDVAGISGDKIQVIYSGIDIGEFADDTPTKSKNGKFTLGVVGRLSVEKGHHYLIEALTLLQGVDYRCLIVGDGPLRKELEGQVIQNKLQERVVFTGFQENVPALMREMDAVVVPSLDETFGITIVEAFASKKVVVATDVGGIPELVKDKVTGYLAPSKNSKALARSIEHVCNNAEEAGKIVANAHKYVLENFTSAIMVKKTLEYYERLAVS